MQDSEKNQLVQKAGRAGWHRKMIGPADPGTRAESVGAGGQAGSA